MSKILVVDIETTGFDPAKDFILELGMVELDLETGSMTEVFDETFKDPGLRAKHRESWIFENDYMDIEVIQKSKPITEYHAEIQTILDEYTGKIVAWNSQFDFKFLRYTKFKLGTPTIDPMKASTKFFKLPHKNGGCCKWPSAQEAWDHLFPDEPQIELHRGLADAFMEARIIHRLITMGVYKM